MIVTEATRGHITLRDGDRTITVWGEMFGKSPGQPDYQIYADGIKCWNPPHEGQAVTKAEKDAILRAVCDYLISHGRTPDVLTE